MENLLNGMDVMARIKFTKALLSRPTFLETNQYGIVCIKSVKIAPFNLIPRSKRFW
jgi:hypothetical protein